MPSGPLRPVGHPTRRDFLKSSSAALVGAGLAPGALALPFAPRAVHSQGSSVIKVGLLGCGGRGSGAAANALGADPGVELVAVGDLFEDMATNCVNSLRASEHAERVKVTPDLSLARIYWTAMGDAARRKQTAKALARAASYVRHLLSTRMTLRRAPEVQFLFDQSVAAQDRVEQILRELHDEAAARDADADALKTSAAPDGAAGPEPAVGDDKPPRV